MKQIQLAGNLLKSSVLAVLLTACHNDQIVAPTEKSEVAVNNENARIPAALRLVKDGQATLQYIKNGKFSGRISKQITTDYSIEYTYDNNNPAGDLWITRKVYEKSSNTLKKEYKYQVVNGRCVTSQNVTYGYSYQYKYNAHNLLDEVQISYNGAGESATQKYIYAPSGAANSFIPYKIEFKKIKSGNIISTKTQKIIYTAMPDKYPLNPGYTELDPYLPIFGKFSHLLPKEIHENELFQGIIHKQAFTTYTYSTDVDGLATSRTANFVCTDNPSVVSYSASLKYSINWQGI
jgi:hypothetical protein